MDSNLLAEIILAGAGLIILGLFGWVVVSIRGMTTEMAQWRVALFGMTGENGMNGEIKQLRRDINELIVERRSGNDRRLA
jgi:hypothetical protein